MAPIPLLAVASCSSDPDDPGIDRSAMTLDACGSTRPLQGVTPGSPVDYLAWREQALSNLGSGATASGDPVITTSEGTPCGNAPEQATCLQSLADLRPTQGFPRECHGCVPSASYVVFTRGHEVGALTSPSDLSSFLAPVSNLPSAALIARVNGYRVECTPGEHNARVAGDGFDILGETGGGCGKGDDVLEHLLHVSKEGVVTVTETKLLRTGDPGCVYGRRPEGFALAGPSDGATPLGRYFAEAAELEAASIPAFVRMAEELTRHGAPAELVERARAAARDEIRHAATMKALARRFGAEPSEPAVPEFQARSLFEMALENAVEGCVHETFAALQATFQSRYASDRRIRKIMHRIAEDETRHGALAWSVAEWIEPLLTDAQREHVQSARMAAANALMESLAEPHADVAHTAGAPTAAQARTLLGAVSGELWAA